MELQALAYQREKISSIPLSLVSIIVRNDDLLFQNPWANQFVHHSVHTGGIFTLSASFHMMAYWLFVDMELDLRLEITSRILPQKDESQKRVTMVKAIKPNFPSVQSATFISNTPLKN